jgi:APA family basic amino acid/polyamine antiporter
MALWATKSIDRIRAEAEAGGEHGLKRVLGALDLTTLGIGAIIGTGIFVLTGQAAAAYAGPAIVVSMVLAGLVSALAALCYSEFASTVPIAGSAYTYGYATLGEFFAWVIGWDLILEYALGAATVAVGWSGYLVSFLKDLGVHFPAVLSAAPGTAVALVNGSTVTAVFNLPAVLVTLFVTTLLVIGIRESASVNTVIVIVKVAVVVIVIAAGAFFVHAANWHPLIPVNRGKFGQYGWSGIVRGAAVIFFAYIGFDAVSTAACRSGSWARSRSAPSSTFSSPGSWWGSSRTASSASPRRWRSRSTRRGRTPATGCWAASCACCPSSSSSGPSPGSPRSWSS